MLSDIADRLKDKRKVILVHGNADMDAISSAYVLSRCFPTADVCALNGMDRVSKMVSEKIGFSVIESFDPEDYELIVTVDSSSPDQVVEGITLPKEKTFVIDHHHRNGKWDGYESYIDDSKVACVEIMIDIIKANGISIDRDMGLMILGGMLTDSGHFQFADTKLLDDFSYVMNETGIHMDEAMSLTKSEPSMSERVSVMKCIERSKFDRVGDMIVATSYGGSFEAAGCRALLLSGADVVFVASQREENFRLSARATQEMVRRGFNLGEIIKDIGTETDNDGGGHDGAAGLSGIGDIEAMLHICMQRTMEEFRKIKRSRESLQDIPDE